MNNGLIDDFTQGMIDDMGGQFPAEREVSLDMEFDTSAVSESELDTGGELTMEGGYHFRVSKVEFNTKFTTANGKEQTPHILLTCVVQESAQNQSPAGSVLWHRIYVAQKDGSPPKKGSIDAMERMAVGLGLMKWKNTDGKSVLINADTGKPGLKIRDFEKAVDRHFCAFVKKEANNQATEDGREQRARFAIPMGRAYHPNHPDVSQIAKNVEALKAAGYAVEQSAPAAPAAPTATVTVATATTTATPDTQQAASDAGADEWGIDSL